MAQKATVKQIIEAMVALLGARAIILAGREALSDIDDIPEVLHPILAMGYAVPARGLINRTFKTKELRSVAFKVLAKMV